MPRVPNSATPQKPKQRTSKVDRATERMAILRQYDADSPLVNALKISDAPIGSTITKYAINALIKLSTDPTVILVDKCF